MRGIAGAFLLALGLGVASYAYYPSGGSGELIGPDFAAASQPAEAGAPTAGGRVFSPQSPLFSPVATTLRPAGAAKPQPAPPAAVEAATVATVTPLAGGKLASTKPVTPEARADLVRDLQRELKRVGCYDGEIDGSWGGGSKRAMNQFTERVNASLPIEEPDYILLTLVQGQKAGVCGEICPAGQSTVEGRCVPKAVLARSGVMRKPASGRTEPAVTVAVAAPISAPKEAIAVRERRAVPAAVAPTVVPATPVAKPAVVARIETQRDVVPPQAEARHEVAPAREPLPGRMAIGGPVAPLPTAAAPVTTSPDTEEPAKAKAPRLDRAPGAIRPNGVHAATPRREARPQPPVRMAAPAYTSGAVRQRSLTYNLFQRPDRAGN